MNREKLETEAKAPDWLDRLVEEIRAKVAQGEHPSLTFLMESLLNELMARERDRHLEDHPGEQANGLCERNLHLTLGKPPRGAPGPLWQGLPPCHPPPHAGSGHTRTTRNSSSLCWMAVTPRPRWSAPSSP